MAHSIALNKDEIALLLDLSDDFYGLWEVDYHLNEMRKDSTCNERAIFLAKFVRGGLMDFFVGPLFTTREPLAPEIALQALSDPTCWALPLEGQEDGYYVITSDWGLEAIRPFALNRC